MRRTTVNLFSVQQRTASNAEHIKEMRRRVADCDTDAQRNGRLRARECPWCFYFGSTLAGQGFTDWVCSCCGKEDTWADTRTPYLCHECSDRLGLCVNCTADIHLTKRTKLERKVYLERK